MIFQFGYDKIDQSAVCRYIYAGELKFLISSIHFHANISINLCN